MVGAVDAHQALVLEAVVVAVVLVDRAEVFGFGEHAADELHHGVVGEPGKGVARRHRVLLATHTAGQCLLPSVSCSRQLPEAVLRDREK